jgi:hypothetical protein
MAKRQGEDQRPAESGPPASYGGIDSLGLATLGGVVAVLVISFASWRDVERIDRSLDERMDKLEARIDQIGTRAPAQAAQRGPDPNRVYTIQTAGAPARGPASAPVTIAEFSDFQ